MNPSFAPPEVLFAALKALHCAAYATRNWCEIEPVPKEQIHDLWEAIHEIPDILTRWRGAESEEELLSYLTEYSEKWKDPDLLARYHALLKQGS